jgi:hypothetical protein
VWGNYRVWTKCETGKCPSLMSPWLCRQPSYPTTTHVVKAWCGSVTSFSFPLFHLIFVQELENEKSNYRLIVGKKPNNKKNWTVKKNWLKFWKNQPVRFGFGFISLKPKKPNLAEPKQKKPSQTGLNRFLS